MDEEIYIMCKHCGRLVIDGIPSQCEHTLTAYISVGVQDEEIDEDDGKETML